MRPLRGCLNAPAAKPGLFRDGGGVRSGWRMALFVVTLLVALVGLVLGTAKLPQPHLAHGPQVSAAFMTVNELLLLVPVLAATALMAWLEGERFTVVANLGGARRAAWFGQGTLAGVVLLAAVLAVLGLGGYAAGGWAGQGVRATLTYAVAWGGVSLLTGVTEEIAFRGYLLHVGLRRGRFWWGALITSLIFGSLHIANSGEGLIGAANAVLLGLFLCLTLRGTGGLFWAIGFHFGWDYGENFIFGTADSGQVCAGAFWHILPRGTAWLSGGATGPEGSIIVTLAVALAVLAVWRLFPRRPVATLVFDMDQRRETC